MVRLAPGLAVGLGLFAGLSACALPPAQACVDYVACQAAVDDTVDTTPWEEGGACWAQPDTARHCEAQCVAALDALRDTPRPPAACLP